MKRPTPLRAVGPAARRRQVLVVILAVAVLAGGLGWLAGTRMRSPAEIALAAAAPQPSQVSAPVEYRQLTSRLVTRGAVGYKDPFTVRLLGAVSDSGEGSAAVVTRIAATGQQVREGTVLLEIAGRPVIAMRGAVPMYRSLGLGDTGADVQQLEAAIGRLHLEAGAPDGRFDAALQRGVQSLYRRLGYAPAKASVEQLTRVGAARTAVRTAEVQLLDARDRNTQSDTAVPPVPAAERRAALRAVGAAEDVLRDALTEQRDAVATAQPRLASGELVFVPEVQMRVQEFRLHVGDPAAGDAAVLTGAARNVKATVDVRTVRLVKAGARAALDPGDGAGGYAGQITSVTVEQKPDGGGSQGVISIAASALPAGISAGTDVRVTIPLKTTGRAVLAVPLGALGSVASGDAVLNVLRSNGVVDRVAVVAGLSADGMVEVTPRTPTLKAGDRVVIGRR